MDKNLKLDIFRVMAYLLLPQQTLMRIKTDLDLCEPLRDQPFYVKIFLVSCLTVDPKFPCNLVKLVLPYLVILALDLYLLYHIDGLPL